MSTLQSLESTLDEVFVKKAPPLPPNGVKAIVKYLPWINLVLGVLALLAALSLWRAAHYVNALVDYANTLGAAYGVKTPSVTHLTVGFWLSLAVLAVEAVIYIMAFPATRDRKKSGWSLMFYALLLNLVYGVVVMFTSYGGAGHLIGSLIGTAIGLYFLFQIRASYLKQPVVHATTPVKK